MTVSKSTNLPIPKNLKQTYDYIMKTYPEAEEILKKIENAQNILLALHVNPDVDSVGSNLALQMVLKKRGKNVTIISCDKPPEGLSFLPQFSSIVHQDPYELDWTKYDLFLSLDSADKQRITRNTKELILPPECFVVVLDHHYANPRFGQINIIDETASSTAEILFNLFKTWNFETTQEIATSLLAAIEGDTGTFRWATTGNTLHAAGHLLDSGANLSNINFQLYQNVPLKSYKYISRVLDKMETKQAGDKKFVWSALSFEEIEALGGPDVATGASEFLATVANTDFGLSLKEEEKGRINGSFRARTDINVADLAAMFGGGGHPTAAGFSLLFEGEFSKSVEEILKKVEKAIS